jgi:hypothetical protein
MAQRTPKTLATVQPGALLSLRGDEWRVLRAQVGAVNRIECVGVSGIVRGKVATFLPGLETDLQVLDPAEVELTPDCSAQFIDARLERV